MIDGCKLLISRISIGINTLSTNGIRLECMIVNKEIELIIIQLLFVLFSQFNIHFNQLDPYLNFKNLILIQSYLSLIEPNSSVEWIDQDSQYLIHY